nr:hypothetical protein [Tanacetum cinerariifolium]
KLTRKDTQVPQPSGPTESITDDDVHKELGDRLAAPNEPSSQGTDSGGGLRCQETIGDTIAQTRVKKLEKRNRSRTHKLKRLYKVSLSARVESFGDEESLGEDASKQGRRIDVIDADEEITLVSVQDEVFNNDADKEMFDVDVLGGDELVKEKEKRAREKLVQEITKKQKVEDDKEKDELKHLMETIPNEKEVAIDAIPLAVKSSKIVKGIVFQEPGKSSTTTTISSQQSQDKGKGIMIEEPLKPKKKDQIRLDEKVAKKLQAEFNEEEILPREKAEKEERANIALIEEWDDI